MKKTKLFSLFLAAVLFICSVPFTAQAEDAAVLTIDGERIALVSSFGKMTYNGKSYTTFKNFNDAFSALGQEGGNIVFTGNIKLNDFNDIEGRKPVTITGIGTKSQGNLLDFTGTEEAPVSEVNLKGDLYLDFLNIRLDEGAYLFTNGYTLETVNEFDTYHTESYVAGGPNIINYPNPPSIAPGEISEGNGIIYLNAGTYTTLSAGSVNGKAVNGNTSVILEGGTVENVVAGNIGSGTMNGNAKLVIGNGIITKLVAGSSGGTINGNVTTEINGGEIAQAVIGAETGATVNGSVIVALNGGNFAGTIEAGSGTVTGKKIVITGTEATANIADGAADVIIKLDGGFCEPQFNGSELTGYLFTDIYGIPAQTITINGSAVTAENGIYQLNDGESNVVVETKVKVEVNKNANYVAGYDDGTFLPQNNITRAEAITLLTRLVTDESNIVGKVKADYDDVQDGAWYESYVGIFQKLGFLDSISGKHGAEIYPNQNITRGEFVELIYQISALSDLSSSMKLKSFSDVDADKYHYIGAVNFAVSEGIIVGYDDGTFKPDNPITRAEVVTIVNRFLGRIPNGAEGTVSFSDISDHWAKSQILAACNEENVTWTADTEKASYTLTGTKAEEYIPALYEQSATLDASSIRDGVDIIAEQMKKDILNTPNTSDIYADQMKTVYYISEKNGDDSNDGKSPETAWKTFEGMKNVRFPQAGITFLFERGGIYRGQCPIYNGAIYGSYGEGDKPLFMQSKKNYADPSLWEATEWENVWKCTEELTNVGVIGFDHDLFDYSEATYDELYGLIMNKDTRGFDGAHELCGDLQFYSDISKGITTPGPLYIYSTEGNPGERFSSIEIGERVNIFSGSPNGCTIDNIAMKFTGAHAIGFGTSRNIRVTNCVFSWLGGSVLRINDDKSATNYGNAVEIYGGCVGYHVENNWMYQIYDTAVTHQRSSSTGDCIQQDVSYLSNLMEYVFWGIEFYNAPPTEDMLGGGKDIYKRVTKNVRSAYNLLRLGGYGWGSITRFRTSRLYCGSTLSENENCIAEYNIFDRAYGHLLTLPGNSTEVEDKNIYIQTIGQPLGNLKGAETTCDYNAADNIANLWGDKNAVVIVIDPEKEPIVRNIPEGLAPATLN